MATKSKSTSKKASARGAGGAKRASGKRTLIKPKGDARYIRRNEKGQIKESDDVGRSLKQDRARKSKATVKAGYGDQGDQKRRGSS